jgi:methyltransferase (TIGR00027 family)
MRKTQASGTAIGAAAVRAIESEKPADERICYDPFARRFIAKWVYLLMKLFAPYGEWHTEGGLTFIVCRSRYIDDYFRDCLKSGTAQLVILGAGLDSRAYRDERHQGAARAFEVDHPASQATKIEQVKKVFGKIPSHVTYVPIDFIDETLDKLLAHGFDRSLKTLFIWEGVTLYLNERSIDRTLSWIHANSALGSSIIFDYQQMSGRKAQVRGDFLYSIVSRLSNEKDVFGFEKGQMEGYLTRRGFTRVVDADADLLTRLYCTGPNRSRKVGSIYSIVHAEVGGSQPVSVEAIS